MSNSVIDRINLPTMKKVRCTLCRHQLPNLKKLKSHYLTKHSKIQIIRNVLQNSIINATPSVFPKSKKGKNQVKYKSVYLHDKVQITYSDDTIVIEDDSNDDNLIELTFSDDQKTNKRKRKNKKKLFHIGIKKVTEVSKSLHEHTGEFYECHCMEKKSSSDVESGSDSGVAELSQHENIHQYYCKLCDKVFNVPNSQEQVEQHVVRAYVCHLCGFEFICKDVLIGHLGYHFEQQTFENILNMEQDYNLYGYCNMSFSTADYYSNINNILLFLTYPYDHYYSRNMFMKIACDICCQEYYIYDYERHVKYAHFSR